MALPWAETPGEGCKGWQGQRSPILAGFWVGCAVGAVTAKTPNARGPAGGNTLFSRVLHLADALLAWGLWVTAGLFLTSRLWLCAGRRMQATLLHQKLTFDCYIWYQVDGAGGGT